MKPDFYLNETEWCKHTKNAHSMGDRKGVNKKRRFYIKKEIQEVKKLIGSKETC